MPDDLLRLWRSARGCCLLLILLALLLALGACVAFGWGLARLTEAADRPALDVLLVLDQSGSLWELGGVGTDPQGLRMEAARLFAAALGVDGELPAYRLGVVGNLALQWRFAQVRQVIQGALWRLAGRDNRGIAA